MNSSTLSFAETASAVAGHLLDVGAVKLNPGNPFTWASGWKSPIYCDNRLTLSFPETRTFIKEQLVALVRQNYPNVQAIAGVATAGIPQGALVADALGLPFLYVRSKPKGHGMENMIEGKVEPGQQVVMVEDLISTGGSSLKAAEAVQKAGAQVLGMAAIFTYGFALSVQNFAQAKLPLFCLSNYSVLLNVAEARGLITGAELETLGAWRQAPETWGQ